MIKARALCIIGMHRSGTSSISRAFNLLGFYLGEEEDVLNSAPDNPEGFWESYEIVCLHEKILCQLSRTWDTLLPISRQLLESNELQSYREELKSLILQKFTGRRLWMWKDPRTAILLPLWKETLKELEVDLSCVFVTRNPIDVVNSLAKRNGIPFDKSYDIWFNYNISALHAAADIPIAFLSYDKFLENWQSELKRCANELEIEWPEKDSHLRTSMESFIRPDLRHSFSSSGEIKDAPIHAQELYELLEMVVEAGKVNLPAFFGSDRAHVCLVCRKTSCMLL